MNQLSFFTLSEDTFSKVPEQITATSDTLWHLFVDGASRNNPGHSGAGIYVTRNGASFLKNGFYLGIKTNNQAEYYALLIGLFTLQSHFKAGDTLIVYADSLLVVRQIEGVYKINKKELASLRHVAFRMLQSYHGTIQHIMRSENTVADHMANQGIDQKHPLPNDFVQMLKIYGI